MERISTARHSRALDSVIGVLGEIFDDWSAQANPHQTYDLLCSLYKGSYTELSDIERTSLSQIVINFAVYHGDKSDYFNPVYDMRLPEYEPHESRPGLPESTGVVPPWLLEQLIYDSKGQSK